MPQEFQHLTTFSSQMMSSVGYKGISFRASSWEGLFSCREISKSSRNSVLYASSSPFKKKRELQKETFNFQDYLFGNSLTICSS